MKWPHIKVNKIEYWYDSGFIIEEYDLFRLAFEIRRDYTNADNFSPSTLWIIPPDDLAKRYFEAKKALESIQNELMTFFQLSKGTI